MLELNENICILREEETSVKRVFNCFFEIANNIIYVVDKQNKFVGVITSGAFLKCLKNKSDVYINHSCSTVVLDENRNIFEQAECIFRRKHITTAIPVLDLNGEVCCEIRESREPYTTKKCMEFHENFRKYKKSYYLANEIKKLREILGNQDIIIIGTEKELEYICGELFLNKKRVTFIKNLDDAYEFMYHNDNLLIDVSFEERLGRRDIYESCCLGFGWEEFLRIIIYIIECEYCSRFHQIIEEKNDITKEYLEKYWIGEILVAQKGIFVAEIVEYLKKIGKRLIRTDGICKYEAFYVDHFANGMPYRVKFAKDLMILDYIDQIIQFYDMNKELIRSGVSVLNFVYDTDTYMTNEEKDRVKRRVDFDKYIEEIGEGGDGKVSLYQGNASNHKGLIELNKDLSFYQVKRFEKDLIVYKDHASRLVNIENGIRKTCYQPKEYIGTVYFLGPCTIYGLYVEDSYTIPSIIQKKINISGKKYRVVNLGNQVQVDAHRLIKILDIRNNDVCVFLFHSVVETIGKNISMIEIGDRFESIRRNKYHNKECFLDSTLHCGDNANFVYADIMYDELKKYLLSDERKIYKNSIYNIFKRNETDLGIFYRWDVYKGELEKQKIWSQMDQKIGGIVVNCNPFTMGHRYLVEYALKVVDCLYVFVVEENKSVFPFEDRFEMVKKGLCDLENVKVIRSGEFIISSVTFPAYFQKDNIDKNKEILLNEDLRLFAQYIAPVLGIRYRFVGEEPQDYVTGQYNIAMKSILPQFGIEVFEIPRRCVGGEAISASKVRSYYHKKEFDKIKELVPKTTLAYLMKKIIDIER